MAKVQGALARAQQLAAQAAQYSDDMREADKGGGGGILVPEGPVLARLVEVVEHGYQPQEYQGKAKDPALEVQLGFALFGGDEYQYEDGNPIIVRMFPMKLSRNEKARAFKVFRSLNWKGEATCFAQLIGSPIILDIVHAQTQQGRTVARINPDGFSRPFDAATRKPYDVPEAPDSYYKLFLWDFPTQESWDSLYVEGTWDDGGSKNKVQERILASVTFAGSPLEALLAGLDSSEGGDEGEDEQTAPAPGKGRSRPASAKPAPAKPAKPAKPAAPAKPAPAKPSAPVRPARTELPKLNKPEQDEYLDDDIPF